MSQPTLSVAMPNYNHAAFLPRAIEGILRQSRPPDEFFILDDASTDNSVEIIESFARRHASIRFIRNTENLGVLAAHEKLYRLAQGKYLYSAAADDDRYPTFFESAMRMAEKHPQAGLIFGKMVTVDANGAEIETEVRKWQEPLFAGPQQFLADFLEVEPPMQAMTGATIFLRSAFEAVGWCRPELGSFADTFAARAIALRHGAGYVPERFYRWHRLPDSFSGQTNQNARQAIDIVARAANLMRSDEFSDRFPADYVHRWARRQKTQVVWNHLLGPDDGVSADRPNFWRRNVARLPRLLSAARIACYRGRST